MVAYCTPGDPYTPNPGNNDSPSIFTIVCSVAGSVIVVICVIMLIKRCLWNRRYLRSDNAYNAYNNYDNYHHQNQNQYPNYN